MVNEVDGGRAINYRHGKKPKTKGAAKEGGRHNATEKERERDEQTTGKKSRLAASGGKLSGTTDGGNRGRAIGGIGGDVRR